MPRPRPGQAIADWLQPATVYAFLVRLAWWRCSAGLRSWRPARRRCRLAVVRRRRPWWRGRRGSARRACGGRWPVPSRLGLWCCARPACRAGRAGSRILGAHVLPSVQVARLERCAGPLALSRWNPTTWRCTSIASSPRLKVAEDPFCGVAERRTGSGHLRTYWPFTNTQGVNFWFGPLARRR